MLVPFSGEVQVMARSGERSIERETFWREQVQRQQASGSSVRQFCAAAELSEASLYAWRRELQRRDRKTPPAFVPVTIAPSLASSGEIVLELHGGRRLHWPIALPTARLVELIHALEGSEAAR